MIREKIKEREERERERDREIETYRVRKDEKKPDKALDVMNSKPLQVAIRIIKHFASHKNKKDQFRHAGFSNATRC